jgi:membrane protease YdiL (CAAX protease family)
MKDYLMNILKNVIKQKPLLSYFIFTYIISWMFLIPSYKILLNAGWNQSGLDSIPPLALIGLLGAFGPSIAAIILTKISGGNISDVLKKLILWKVNIKWYLFVLFVPSILLGISVLISQLFGFSLGQAVFTNIPIMFLSAILLTLPFGPLAEELGWRGYALPKLLNKYNPLVASLILGLFWTFWHIPAFFVPGVAIPSVFEVNILTIFLYLLNNIGLSLIFTGIFFRTKGSVLLAILLHAGSNASQNIIYSILPAIESVAPHRLTIYILNILLVFIIGLIMINKQKFVLNSKHD